jgi:hypothetical protein
MQMVGESDADYERRIAMAHDKPPRLPNESDADYDARLKKIEADKKLPPVDRSFDPALKRMNHSSGPQKVVDRPDAPLPPPAPPAQMVGESDDEYKKRAALPPAKDVPVK